MQNYEGLSLKVQVARARPEGKTEKEYNDTNKVIVNCLSWNTTDESLRAALEQFGPVEECTVCIVAIWSLGPL